MRVEVLLLSPPLFCLRPSKISEMAPERTAVQKPEAREETMQGEEAEDNSKL
jgi:hypothetical protein